jgi:hypothetical protein
MGPCCCGALDCYLCHPGNFKRIDGKLMYIDPDYINEVETIKKDQGPILSALELKDGDSITYHSFNKKENGIVKSISDEKHVFVVYHCGNDWDNYKNYTAARTHIDDLTKGWED